MSEISIIIPCFNGALYIEDCLKSVCGQTIADQLQIIMIDDGSTDGSADIARRFLENHNRLNQAKIICLPENKGVANARITGIKEADGEYIMSFDADDWVDSTMCEKMLQKARKEDCSVVVCDYNSIKGEKKEVITGCYKEPFLQQLILCTVTGSLCNKLVRTELFRRPDFRFPTHDFSEDYVYSLQFAIRAKKIGYVPEPLYNYVHRAGSQVQDQSSEKRRKRYEDDIANFALDLEILEAEGLLEKYREEIIAHKLKVKNTYKEDKELWKKTYPELGREIFHSSNISWRSRASYLMTEFGRR